VAYDSILQITQQLIERLDVRGPAPTFNAPVTAAVIGGTLHGGDHQTITTTQRSGVQADEIAALLVDVLKMARELDAQRASEIGREVQKFQNVSPDRSGAALRELAKSIRNICEGAIGGIGATGILALLAKFSL
jgi:hypothetical protein